MKQVKPAALIAGLQSYVSTNREEALGPHQSLYAELLHQWQMMDRCSRYWTSGDNRRQATRYWRGMAEWYQHFLDARERVLAAETAIDDVAVDEFYGELLADYSAAVIDQLPQVDFSQPVIQVNDFATRLFYQLEKVQQLDLTVFTMMDYQLLVDYWHQLAQSMGDGNDED